MSALSSAPVGGGPSVVAEIGPSKGGSNGRSYEGLIFSPLTAAAGPWLMSPRGRQGFSVETGRAAAFFAATNRP